ncbi:MAG TPA: glycoside hydrolase [Candidatus Bathyarchaeia archaeon]|nr:glycoside hydrolase [Candidatus Bathyarchaeia archaeon]
MRTKDVWNGTLFLLTFAAVLAAGCATFDAVSRAPAVSESADGVHKVAVDWSVEHQVIDNFGASDCWRFQMIGAWSLENRNRLADLLFSTTEGIGLSCWRFNLGAGKDPGKIGNVSRTAETFEVAEGEYDWSRQASEQWFLGAAKARGVDQFVAFVNSPPTRMTRNGLSHCSPDLGTTNLKEGYEGQFARYLADILKHFRDHPDASRRIDFDWVSPVNEPQWDWNGQSQEGNRASNADIKTIILALGTELEQQGLDTKILGVESGHMADMRAQAAFTTLQYREKYGDYLDEFCGNPEVNKYLGNVIGWHSYQCDLLPRLFLWQRRKLGEKLQEYPGWRFWQTEYCVMQGPEGAGGGGRDLGMKTALDVARVIHHDLVLTNVSAWQWWTALSTADYKDGLIYTDYGKEGDPETIYPAKLLWVFGNYARFIRPGAKRVELQGADDLYGLLGSAYKSAAGDDIAIVFINMAETKATVSLKLEGLPAGTVVKSFTPHVTSENDDLRAYPAVDGGAAYVVPGRSAVTLVGTLSTSS